MSNKIDDKKLRTVQVTFNKLKDYDNISEDTRFTEVLIKILNLGKNYNGSIFAKEVVEDAIPTLANIPIVGYIENNKDGDEDFSDHRVELVNKNGKPNLEYLNSCYGVIPESFAKEAYFEDEICSDGIERTYLFVKGLLFTSKFDYLLDIFNDENGIKSQSMELDEDYEGHWEDDGFMFDKFKFSASCILGRYVDPAMIGSTVSIQFSATDVAKEIENKLNEFAKYFSKPKEVEETDMAKKKVKEEVLDNEKPNEEKVEEVVETNNEKVDEIKETEEEVKTENAKDDKSEEDSKEEKDEEYACDDKKKYSLNFSLSHEDIRNELYEKLWDMSSLENTCYGIVKTKDDYFVYVDFCDGTFYKQSYSTTNDDLSFVGEREKVFDVIVDEPTYNEIESVTYSKLKEDLEVANKKIEEYSKTNSELLEFKSNVEEENRKAEIDKVIAQFSAIDGLDLESYRLKAYNKEIEKDNLEKELYSVLGRQNFSKMSNNQEPNNGASFGVSLKEPSKCPYENLEDLFKL